MYFKDIVNIGFYKCWGVNICVDYMLISFFFNCFVTTRRNGRHFDIPRARRATASSY